MAQTFTSKWTHLPDISGAAIAEARTQAHFAVQWPGRFGRAYGTPAPDDSHTSLTWDASQSALVNGIEKQKVSFAFPAMTLTIGNQDVLALEGKTESDLRVWIGNYAKTLGLDHTLLDASLPYDMPPSELASGAKYGGKEIQAGTAYLEQLYGNAASLLEGVVQSDSRALPARCWPHHFDMATLIALEPQTSEESKSVGVGMSPGDDNYATPYFYVTPWPYPPANRLSPLPAPGFWHTEGWVGGILKVGDLSDQANPSATLDAFVLAAWKQAEDLLSQA